MNRCQVLLSAAMSLDGFIDDKSPQRLLLSSAEDFAEVYALRASCAAVLVGATTVRLDNPALVTKDAALRSERIGKGLPADPIKMTLTTSGDLDPGARFFQLGAGRKVVYCPAASVDRVQERLGAVAEIRGLGTTEVLAADLVRDAAGLGVNRLLVEGGTSVITMFLREGVVDQIRLAIAPFLLGDRGRARWVEPQRLPGCQRGAFELSECRQCGGTAVLFLRRVP